MIQPITYNYSSTDKWYVGAAKTYANQITSLATDGSKSVFDLLKLVKQLNYNTDSANAICLGTRPGGGNGIIRLFQTGDNVPPSSFTLKTEVKEALKDVIDLLYEGVTYFFDKDRNIVVPNDDLTNVIGLIHLYSDISTASSPTNISFSYFGNPNTENNWYRLGTLSLANTDPETVYVNAYAAVISQTYVQPLELKAISLPISDFVGGMIDAEVGPAVQAIKQEVSKKFVSR